MAQQQIASTCVVSVDGSPVAALVIPTDENLMIARHTRAVVAT